MTIHHDKLAYGKLAPTKEELSESDILKMLAKLNSEEEAEDTPQPETENGKSENGKLKNK